jgi:hypothetical protein
VNQLLNTLGAPPARPVPELSPRCGGEFLDTPQRRAEIDQGIDLDIALAGRPA